MVSRGKGKVSDFWRNLGELDGTGELLLAGLEVGIGIGIGIGLGVELEVGGGGERGGTDRKAMLGGAWRLL